VKIEYTFAKGFEEEIAGFCKGAFPVELLKTYC